MRAHATISEYGLPTLPHDPCLRAGEAPGNLLVSWIDVDSTRVRLWRSASSDELMANVRGFQTRQSGASFPRIPPRLMSKTFLGLNWVRANSGSGAAARLFAITEAKWVAVLHS